MIHNPLTEILWGIKSKIDRLGQNERLKCPNDKNTLYRTGLSCHRLLKKLFTFQPPDRSLLTWLIRRLDHSRLFWCLLLSSSLIRTIYVCSWIRNHDTSFSVIVRTVFPVMRGWKFLRTYQRNWELQDALENGKNEPGNSLKFSRILDSIG